MSELRQIQETGLNEIDKASNIESLEGIRISFLGKKGKIAENMKTIGSLPPEKRKEFGAEINAVKLALANAIDTKKELLEEKEIENRLSSESIDISVPPRPYKNGKIHPITQVIEETAVIFAAQGFSVADGPEIEDDYHNFTALNIPKNHPAREMQDTFYMEQKESENTILLRTHTSSVQIRKMNNEKPPFKFIAPGRVYRSDYDMTHTPMFHQIEGVFIDENIHMGHLKGCLHEFLRLFFEVDEVPIRFRPSFFPFTEPSAEVDIGCSHKDGQLLIGQSNDWMEILGCGMVHPNVLKNVDIDPEKYQGFAFGIGIERLAMLKYGMPDLRNFFDSDKRWLDHYSFSALDIPSLIGGLSK